jgi:multidrug resistance efflux pump
MSDKTQSEDNGKTVPVPKASKTGSSPVKPGSAAPVSRPASKAVAQKPKKAEVEKPGDSAVPVKTGALIVFLMIAMSLTWYLLADRFSPYTSQARVQGYIVGVSPKVSGLVTEVYVQNNEEVGADQLLFEIDSSQYEIALNKARSDLESARRQLNAGDASVNSAEANLRAAEANEIKAQQDLRRLSRLHKDDPGTISVRRIEISKATLEQAQAGVTAAKAAIEQAIEQKGGDDDATNSFLKSAQAAVARAELDLGNTRVKSSGRGVISNLIVDVGQYATAGSPVMTLVSIQDVWINAEFTENNLGHMQVGSPVEILFDVLPGEVFSGSVRSIGLGISTGQTPAPGTLPSIENNRDWLRQSQRFPVLISFDINQHPRLRRQLRVGGQASVIAYTQGHDLMRSLGRFYIRFMSWLSYAY